MTAFHPARTSQYTSKFGTPVQNAALAVGAVFLAVGVLGFVPGITTNYDQLTFAGHHPDAALLGIFNVSVLHNLVHLAFGVAGIALARTCNSARSYLIGQLRSRQRRGQLAAPGARGRHHRPRCRAGPQAR
jgi:Domain of unknown function (DUF4383)